MIKIAIGGDLYVNSKHYKKDILSTEIIKFMENYDFRILNLEAPVYPCKKGTKIEKTGPHLNIEEKHAKSILSKLKIDLLTLANNHILDYGVEGLDSTLKFCKKNKIEHVGVGSNLNNASSPYIFTLKNKKIAVLNFAENEWGNATNDDPGANPIDIIENVRQIKDAKKKNDIVLVIVHGGNEYLNVPSPRMVKQYRFYAENGASAIIGHHPHCISGYEKYEGVPIIYSLGNFLFTINSKFEDWYTGCLLNLIIKQNDELEFSLIPVRQDKKDFTLRFLTECERDGFENKILNINKVIDNQDLLLSTWQEFCQKKRESYFMALSPLSGIKSRIFRAILFRSKIFKLFFNKGQKKHMTNLIRCEAHHDVLKQILK